VKFVDGKSAFKGVLTAPKNDCLLLFGPTSLAGKITIKWKTVGLITPTETTVTVPEAFSVSTGFFYPAFSPATSYSLSHIGTPNTPLSTTGAFSGDDNGAGSYADIVSSEDLVDIGAPSTILDACGAGGVQTLTIGIGVLANG
jgi:hypothetical protein